MPATWEDHNHSIFCSRFDQTKTSTYSTTFGSVLERIWYDFGVFCNYRTYTIMALVGISAAGMRPVRHVFALCLADG